MIKKFIDKIFNKKEEKGVTSETLFGDETETIEYCCDDCPLKGKDCSGKVINELRNNKLGIGDSCLFEEEIKQHDPDKDTFFIIDDNEGMVSFLEDDVEYFDKYKVLNAKDINILSLSGNHSAFVFELLQERLKGLNIKWAIIDITLGGSIMTEQGNIKYTGVDVLEMILKYNPEVNFLFYTGNNLNPYIKRNKKLINQFNNITGNNIEDYTLFKTSMDMQSRRKFIAERLFGKEI